MANLFKLVPRTKDDPGWTIIFSWMWLMYTTAGSILMGLFVLAAMASFVVGTPIWIVLTAIHGDFLRALGVAILWFAMMNGGLGPQLAQKAKAGIIK